MSANTSTTAHSTTLWGDTQAGRSEAFAREKMQQQYDFQGAIERQGVKAASRMMRDEIGRGE